MAIGPVILNGTISRTLDYSSVKHNESNKGIVDQTNYQSQFNKVVDQKLHKVNSGDETSQNSTNFDAKEKGNGSYSGDGGKRKKTISNHKQEGIPREKKVNFDIRI